VKGFERKKERINILNFSKPHYTMLYKACIFGVLTIISQFFRDLAIISQTTGLL